MDMEKLHHIDMLEKDMGLQLRLRRHQASTSSLLKGSSISKVATSSGFKLPKKSAVAWWFPRKKIRKQFLFPFIIEVYISLNPLCLYGIIETLNVTRFRFFVIDF